MHTDQFVHINNIQAGDTVIHDGKEMLVCNNDIKFDGFMGRSIFGDCYRIGNKLVQKKVFKQALTNA
jgi:hypothetical protein